MLVFSSSHQLYTRVISNHHPINAVCLPGSNPGLCCFESTTKLAARVLWVSDAIAVKGTFTMDKYQAGYLT